MEKLKKTLRDSAGMRWLVLILISSLMFSTYYFQDFFSPLKDLMQSEFGINSEEFGRIIALTTIANVFGMIIIGGIILDKWGIRLAGLAFGSLATLGGVVIALASLGVFGEDKGTVITWMIIGRVLFGSGLEVVCVVVTKTIVKWFKGYELALAMAINMGFGRLGSALAIAISLDIAGVAIAPAAIFAASLIGMSLIFFLVYIIFDVRLDGQTNNGVKKEHNPEDDFKFSDLVKLATNKSFIYIALLCVAFYSAVFPFMQYAPDLLVNKFEFSYVLPEGATFIAFGSEALGSTFVYIILFAFALSITLVPANLKGTQSKMFARIIIVSAFAALVFANREVLGQWMINGPKVASLIPLGTIIFTPIFGSIVDKKGKAATLMILGSLLLIFAHLSLSVFNSVTLAYAGLLSLGVAFSLVPAAMWPSVAKIVAENRLGTAYASMFTVQNWGLLAFFWGIGALLNKVNPVVLKAIEDVRKNLLAQGFTGAEVSDKIKIMQLSGELPYYDYTWPILMLVACGIISIFLAFKLKQADKEQGYGLELPSNG
ncbi:MFS transporter [Perlabentimonas gracilis]|uniref:MFS transporter n=1 Tax=Perlabentimonas gracilis TaxID=2715279 RepID=UPI001407B4FC|nr:MFS transporter [Perlabentimonas gracilis]NHB67223.1 major facilitator superfamily domain-containing protein 1 [Perlabentimonas gracilis]